MARSGCPTCTGFYELHATEKRDERSKPDQKKSAQTVFELTHQVLLMVLESLAPFQVGTVNS